MRTIVADERLIAACGLYCGAWRRYLQEKCPGCRANEKAKWCKVRTCNLEHSHRSCADCAEFSEVKDCKKHNNWIAGLFGLIFRSNRAACIDRLRAIGTKVFAAEMAAAKRHSLPR